MDIRITEPRIRYEIVDTGPGLYERYLPPPVLPPRFPPTVRALLLANALVFLAQMGLDAFLVRWLALWPLGTPELLPRMLGDLYVPGFRPWQLVSYSLLHGGLAHLFFNMFALWMFGRHIENAWGSRLFAFYYFVCVVGAGLVQLGVVSATAESRGFYPTVGASGGVFGILLAFGMMFPNQRIVLLFPPIPMKAKYFVVIYGVIELWLGITGTFEGVAHFAHLGGMLFGLLLILYWKRNPPPPRPGHDSYYYS